MDTKTCSICGKTLPVNREHFRYRVQDGKGYYTAECSECIAKAKKASRARKLQKKADALAKIEEAGVNVFLSSVTRGGSNIPHTAEVVERVMEHFGGVGGFSAVLVKQYWDSQPGGTQRNRLLETLCRLVTRNVETGGAKKPLQFWSEEELEEELQKRFAEAVAEYEGITIDAEKEEAPECLPAPDAQAESEPDSIPARLPQGVAERVEREAMRSIEALSTKPKPRKDTSD